MNLSLIPALVSEGVFHIVVEAPRGTSLKLKYEPRWRAMSVSRPLPLGLAYPFDWGFVPSTRRRMATRWTPCCSGTWHRIRVLSSRAARSGSSCRTEPYQPRSSGRIRNDRIMAIPFEARREHGITDVTRLLRPFDGTRALCPCGDRVGRQRRRIVGWGDAGAALKLVRESAAGLRRAVSTRGRRARPRR